MTLGGLAAGLAVALLAGLVSRTTVLREDATLASFYLISLAAGVLIVSLRGSNIDLMHVLFGTVLALDDPALFLLAGIASATLLAMALLWRPLVLECVDAAFLRSVSRTSGLAHGVLLVLVVINLVGGFQALGTLLSVGLMILPAASARFWAARSRPADRGGDPVRARRRRGRAVLSYHRCLAHRAGDHPGGRRGLAVLAAVRVRRRPAAPPLARPPPRSLTEAAPCPPPGAPCSPSPWAC